MEGLFTLDNLFTLAMLILLQLVLGFDNLLYISIESKRAPREKQAMVRRMGIAIAVVFRLILLFAIVSAIKYFQDPFFSFNLPGIAKATFNIHAVIVLAGGIFLIYTALKEIYHMLGVTELGKQNGSRQRSAAAALFWIVLMNLIFSFDSILSAMALSDVFLVMAAAIVISAVIMVLLADNVAEILEKNRMYEVLGLFILLIVGIMLLSEGGHLSHLYLFGNPVLPMAKTTFYFVIAMLVLVDVVQSRYQKKLLATAKETTQIIKT